MASRLIAARRPAKRCRSHPHTPWRRNITQTMKMTPTHSSQYSVCELTTFFSSRNIAEPIAGPDDRAGAAEDHHDDRVAGQRPVQDVARHERVLQRVEAAADARDRAGHRERDELEALHRVAGRAHPLLVLADADEDRPERRRDQPTQEPQHQHEAGGHDVELHVALVERQAEQRRPAEAGQPVGAAGHAAPLDRDRHQELRERHRQHQERDAADANREEADHAAASAAETTMPATKPIQPDTPEVHAEDHHRVRRRAEERRVTERQQSRVADQEVEAHREDREHQHLGREARRVAAGQRHEREHDDQREPRERVACGRGAARSGRAHALPTPKSPFGRVSSTTTIRR